MTMYAVISDIHGNYQALLAVERDARREARKANEELHFICLGDVVDYGPQPNDCSAWVQKNVTQTIRGNHDRVVSSPDGIGLIGINEDYWPITLWTRRVLNAAHKNWLHRLRGREQLQVGKTVFTLFHGSLRRGDNISVNDSHIAEQEINSLRSEYGLFGHTHYQGYFSEGALGAEMFLTIPENAPDPPVNKRWKPVRPGEWQPLVTDPFKAIFNPGSVGQPRYHALLVGARVSNDYRASYLLLRVRETGENEFCFRRVEYNIDETIRLLKNLQWPDDDSISTPGSDVDRERDLPIGNRVGIEEYRKRLPSLIHNVLIPMLRGVRE